jgi:hypothetical protein
MALRYLRTGWTAVYQPKRFQGPNGSLQGGGLNALRMRNSIHLSLRCQSGISAPRSRPAQITFATISRTEVGSDCMTVPQCLQRLFGGEIRVFGGAPSRLKAHTMIFFILISFILSFFVLIPFKHCRIRRALTLIAPNVQQLLSKRVFG